MARKFKKNIIMHKYHNAGFSEKQRQTYKYGDRDFENIENSDQSDTRLLDMPTSRISDLLQK